ncbi:MAG TPA: LolA-related protein [Steroidobacteraceae bacterium]|jgi:hypothetical protein|nr:LolA-related protein [Steroidobacteraceae bacterium]
MLLSALLLMGMAPAGQAEAPGGIEALEQRLARTPPVSTDFVEYRFSHLLKKPLRSGGTLEYRADGALVRNVTVPYRESTTVLGDQVRIARAGKPERTMALQRAPQLRVLLGSFRALLEGHLTPLQQDFDVALEEDAARWTLRLKPKDSALARHLARIEVHGNGDRPGCMEALEPDGDGSLTLFGAAPDMAAPLPTRPEIENRCRAPGAAAVQ